MCLCKFLSLFLKKKTKCTKLKKKISLQSYSFAVQVFIRPSENYILSLVKKSEISIEKSHRLIDNLLGKFKKVDEEDEDIVIVQSSVKVKMKCPLTFRRMKQPVRGINCKHIDVSLSFCLVVLI